MGKNLSFHPAIQADRMEVLTLDFGKPFADQVRAFFEAMADTRDYNITGLPGQAVAAALALPALEMTRGLPTMSLFGFGKEVKVLGSLDLSDYRHNHVRPRRTEVPDPDGEAYAGYTILDGSGRGVEEFQLAEIVAALNTTPDLVRVFDVSMGHIDPANPEAGLVDRLIQTGLVKADWTSGRLIYLPPGFGPLAIVMATAIYGLSEVWPRVIRLNREADGTFHVAEICDPQAMRQFGVQLRAKWDAGNAPVAVPRELYDRLVTELAGTKLADELVALTK